MIKNNFNKIAKEVITREIIALKKLNKCFDKSFIKAIEIVSKCKGKLILAGSSSDITNDPLAKKFYLGDKFSL